MGDLQVETTTSPSGNRFTIGDREFEIQPHGRGLYRLLLWTAPGASVIVGIFANPETCRYTADHLPADYDPSKAAKHGTFGFGETK